MKRLLVALALLLISQSAQAQLGIEGGNLATLVAQIGAVTASPPANTIGDRLKTINTTLGSPFQAGGSIGNTSFGVSGTLPAFAAIPAFKIDQTTPGTTNLVALGANQSVNVAQMNGVATTMGNGIAGTGVQRVAIASDNTAFPVNATLSAETTKVIGTVNQGTSPWVVSNGGTFATQLTGATNNINNIAGTVTLPTGAATAAKQPALGTAGTASTDVITVQGAASMTKLLVTPDSVALPANQSVNVAQVNGVATSVNTGAAGTGTQRVTLSNTDPCKSPDIAKSSAIINITSATTTSLVAVSGSTVVYVCGYTFSISQVATTANTLAFEYGTGAACTSPTLLTGTYGAGGITAGAPITITAQADRTIFKSAASAGICALTTIGASASFQGVLTYVQQ